jgi:hypothetical protein
VNAAAAPATQTPASEAADELPYRLPAAPPPAPFLAPVVGRVVRCDSAGAALVEYPGNPLGRPVAARATTPLDASSAGSDAVLLFENGDPARPIVVGLVRPVGGRPGVTAEADGERVVVSAEREVVLRCGEASITLTAAGKVLIRGTYVLSRSSGANRIKGAAVEIN